jgi:hypothetical protein
VYSSWYYNNKIAALQWVIMGVTYRISEKEEEKHVLERTDLTGFKTVLGEFPSLGEAIGLAERDAHELIR